MQPETPKNELTTPELSSELVVPLPPPTATAKPQETKIDNSRRLSLDETLANKQKKKTALMYAGFVLLIGIIASVMIVQAGLKTDVYSIAQSYSNYATLVGWLMAITTGLVSGYIVAHPSHTNGQKGTGPNDLFMLLLIGFGLFAGVIPGIIALIVYIAAKRSHRTNANNQIGQTPLTPKPAHWFVILLGFLFGVLPGLIISIIISYPLSQHACRLSGSKYC